MAAVVVAVTAAASAEAVAFVAAALTVAFAVAGFTVPLTAVAFVAAAFVMAAFAAVGSTIAASTIGSSSLVILGTRSFTIPIHTTGTIPIAIILAIILMVTDTAALPTAVFVAVAFMAVGDPYNQSVYKAVLDTPTSWLDKFSSVWLVGDYYYSSIDGASDDGTRRVIREHKREIGLPEGWQDRSTTAKRTDGSTSPRRGSR